MVVLHLQRCLFTQYLDVKLHGMMSWLNQAVLAEYLPPHIQSCLVTVSQDNKWRKIMHVAMQFYACLSFQHCSTFIKEYDVSYRIVSGTNYLFQYIVRLRFFFCWVQWAVDSIPHQQFGSLSMKIKCIEKPVLKLREFNSCQSCIQRYKLAKHR